MANLKYGESEKRNPTLGVPGFDESFPSEAGASQSYTPWPAYGVTFGLCECGTVLPPLPVEHGSMSDGEIYPERCLACQPSYAHIDGCKCERCEEDRCSLLSEVLWDIARTASVALFIPRMIIEVMR